MPHVHTPTKWYGAVVMPDGRVQCIEARTLPRTDETNQVILELPFAVATDPARAEWPSR